MCPPLSAKLWFPSPYAAQDNQGNIIYSAQVSLRLRDNALVWWLSADGSYTKLLKSVGLCWCVPTGKQVRVADVRQWLDHTNLSTPAVGQKALLYVLHKVLILLYAASGCLLKSVFVLAIFVMDSVLSVCLQLARRAWAWTVCSGSPVEEWSYAPTLHYCWNTGSLAGAQTSKKDGLGWKKAQKLIRLTVLAWI